MIPDAVLHVLETAWRALTPLDKPMAVMGGLALSAWKRLRATQDIDILIAISAADVPQVCEALSAVHVTPRGSSSMKSLGAMNILQLTYAPPDAEVEIAVDLLFGDSEFLRQVLDRSISAQIHGIRSPIRVVACEDLVLLKLHAGRIVDLADAAALLRANRESVDKDYLQRWTAALGVSPEYDQVRREAWPDDGAAPAQ